MTENLTNEGNQSTRSASENPTARPKQRREEMSVNLDTIAAQAKCYQVHVAHLVVLEISQQCRVAQHLRRTVVVLNPKMLVGCSRLLESAMAIRSCSQSPSPPHPLSRDGRTLHWPSHSRPAPKWP